MKIASVEIFVNEDNASRLEELEGNRFRINISTSDEKFQAAKRGIDLKPKEEFEGPLVHELGHLVQHLVREYQPTEVANEERAWTLGRKMGHVNSKIERAAVGTYKEPEENFESSLDFENLMG